MKKNQEFLFFISEDFNDSLIESVQSFVFNLADIREWRSSAPEFVNEIELPENPDLDLPINTLGGILCLCKPGETSAIIEKRLFEDFNFLMNRLALFSVEIDHEFEFELDGIHVGSIEKGELDSLLRDGLLGEWEKRLIDSGADD